MKYYLYIDECGDNNLKNFDEQFPIFTLCGVIVSEEKREWLEQEVQALKEEFWGNQYTILHSRDIRKCQRGFEILFDLDVKKRFSEEQIIGFLREAEAGLAIKDPCRRHGFSEASYYLWRSKFGGMSVPDAKRLKDLEAENARLKARIAALEAQLEKGGRL
jgi:putative transposase